MASTRTNDLLPAGEYYALAFLASLYTIWMMHIGLSFLVWLYRINDYILQLDRVVELRIDEDVSAIVKEALEKLLLNEPEMAHGNSDSEKNVVPRSSDHSSGVLSNKLETLLQKHRENKNIGKHMKTRRSTIENAADWSGSFKRKSSTRIRQTRAGHRRTFKSSRWSGFDEDKGQDDCLEQDIPAFSILENSEDSFDFLEVPDVDEEEEGASERRSSSLSRRESTSTIFVVGRRKSDSLDSYKEEDQEGVVVCSQQLLDSSSSSNPSVDSKAEQKINTRHYFDCT